MAQETSLTFETQKDLSQMTSWLVGGKADHYCAPKDLDQLGEALLYAFEKNWPVSVLGGGSNILISDAGVRGLLIHTAGLQHIEVLQQKPDFELRAWCGTPKSEVLKHFLKQKLAPAVFLAGLPGDVAGGVVMNAGVGHEVHPKEFCEIVSQFEVMSVNDKGQLQRKWVQKESVHWHYRRSENWQPGVITQVDLSWPYEPDPNVNKQVSLGNQRRKATQPLTSPSCGSVFKNPKGDHAGRLIETAGLKGYRFGGAQVSEKHANFIVNLGGATASDIHHVIEHVQNEVFNQFQISLTHEVIYLGAW